LTSAHQNIQNILNLTKKIEFFRNTVCTVFSKNIPSSQTSIKDRTMVKKTSLNKKFENQREKSCGGEELDGGNSKGPFENMGAHLEN